MPHCSSGSAELRYHNELRDLFRVLPAHLATTSDRRGGGGAEPGCTLSQISRFNSASSAASARARSRSGMCERKAVGVRSSSGQVLGKWANGAAAGREAEPVHNGVAAASYWLSGAR